ncbi:uncharacterized protein EAE98_000859 [Botrytis deweyae]|uniref:Alpha/beta hydrolase n=1 Tax=Botrytis deweyae TaxID=2478750 RepID=A0ABQ7IZU8_9HELO|nr:uncharacterized protein EAE98_000859 [Botrytis deweyae]KAF7938521.1 hypothetical protein EAE98_000859 [Botrytis deweyae]
MVMHAEQDYWHFYPCTQLAACGYTVLCGNNAASKTGLMNDLDFPATITNVVLWGHSGGEAMISEYQNTAENGVSACKGPEKISICSDDHAGLPPADGVILHDANYGLSTMGFISLNAAIKNESTGLRDIDATLHLYNTTYGYNASGGSSNYTANFLFCWSTAAVSCNNRLLTFAQGRADAISNYNTSDALFDDDEGFIIPDSNYLGTNNKLISQDNSTVRVAIGFNIVSSFYDGAFKTTIGRYLRTFAIKVNDDYKINADGIDGIQWNSSHIVPINTYLNAEKAFLASGSNDTSKAFVEGAKHTINPCTDCETYPGQYNNTIKNAFNYQAAWLEKAGRFI